MDEGFILHNITFMFLDFDVARFVQNFGLASRVEEWQESLLSEYPPTIRNHYNDSDKLGHGRLGSGHVHRVMKIGCHDVKDGTVSDLLSLPNTYSDCQRQSNARHDHRLWILICYPPTSRFQLLFFDCMAYKHPGPF